VADIRAQLAPGTPGEVWFQDEMRVGQKNKLTYRWARKGWSITAVTPGTPLSTSPGKLCPSPTAIGPSSVTHCEGWYNRRVGLWRAVQILGDVRRHLHSAVTDGKIAQGELDRLAGLNRARQ